MSNRNTLTLYMRDVSWHTMLLYICDILSLAHIMLSLLSLSVRRAFEFCRHEHSVEQKDMQMKLLHDDLLTSEVDSVNKTCSFRSHNVSLKDKKSIIAGITRTRASWREEI